MNIDFLKKHGLANADICDLAKCILQASVIDQHPNSAAGHVRAAMSISNYIAGYEAGGLTPREEAMLLASRGRDFGSEGEIGGVNVYVKDGDDDYWVVWVCNPLVSTWINVGQLLDEIGDGMQVIEWYGTPIKIRESDRHPVEPLTSTPEDSEVPDIPQQGGFANISKELFE